MEEHFPGYQEPETFEIYHCLNCNTAFSYPRISAYKIYENIYKNADRIPGYERYHKHVKNVKRVKNPLDFLAKIHAEYFAVRDALRNVRQQKEMLKILEIGCGLGYLTYSLRTQGYNAKGLDISQNAVDNAIKEFGNYYICADVNEYAKQNIEQYDVIISTEVIEHIDDVLKFINSIMIMLKKGAIAVITTPNKTIFSKNTIWQTDLPPVHLWWFSEESMKYMANKTNTDITFVDFTKYCESRDSNLNIVNINPDNIFPHPMLNKNGYVYDSKIRFKYKLKKLPIVMCLYELIKSLRGSLKTYFPAIRHCGLDPQSGQFAHNKDIFVQKKEGIILGAIFHKKM